jgi:hypothetical protein
METTVILNERLANKKCFEMASVYSLKAVTACLFTEEKSKANIEGTHLVN